MLLCFLVVGEESGEVVLVEDAVGEDVEVVSGGLVRGTAIVQAGSKVHDTEKASRGFLLEERIAFVGVGASGARLGLSGDDWMYMLDAGPAVASHAAVVASDEEEDGGYCPIVEVFGDRSLVKKEAGLVVGLAESAKRMRAVVSVGGSSAFRRSGRVGQGAQGEVWRGRAVNELGQPTGPSLVLKRLFGSAHGDNKAVRSGWREIYFGGRTSEMPHVARFVEGFVRQR